MHNEKYQKIVESSIIPNDNIIRDLAFATYLLI